MPATPPFVCDFNTESSFADNWDVINANDDGQMWYFNDYRADSGVAALEYSLSYLESDDYLVTLRPVALPAGSAYFVFDYAGNFLHKLHRVGQGPGEYAMISSMSVDEGENRLSVTEAGNRVLQSPANSDKKLESYGSRLSAG